MSEAVVRSMLAAAERLYQQRRELAPEIARSTGLSEAGVVFGFESLERRATDRDVARLLTRALPAEEVAVVLSANVFVASFRALVLARASAPRVRVRPSRRDPAFARMLVQELGDPSCTLDPELDPATVERGVIHAYGRDETLAALTSTARVPVIGHGSGMGVAVIGADDILDESALALADDVVAFDQRGCLSPRVAVVIGGAARALAFGRALSEALAGVEIARGDLTADEHGDARRYVETMTASGSIFAGSAHAVGVGAHGAPVLVPPPGRHVHVASAELSDWENRLGALARFVVAVGSSDGAVTGPGELAHARCLPLGAMQRPPLDGPVDMRSPPACAGPT